MTNPLDQRSALDIMRQTLAAWGLSSLQGQLHSLVVDGYTGDTLSFALQDTPEYKQRFSANDARRAAGLPVLSPAQYIAAEEQYRSVLASYGLPKGFYDTHQDVDRFIAGDVSPSEVADRAAVAHDQYVNAPAETKALWSDYGFSQGDAIAAILDPKVATQVIKDRGQQVAIGGAAAEQGLTVGQPRAQAFQQAGATLAGARSAFAQIAQALPTDTQIGQRFGTQINQETEENADLLNDADAQQKLTKARREEEGLFQGGGGATQQALAPDTAAVV